MIVMSLIYKGNIMGKGQKSNKEVKKPKKEKLPTVPNK
jgi:hypothetical protein